MLPWLTDIVECEDCIFASNVRRQNGMVPAKCHSAHPTVSKPPKYSPNLDAAVDRLALFRIAYIMTSSGSVQPAEAVKSALPSEIKGATNVPGKPASSPVLSKSWRLSSRGDLSL
jgi:hypothetical protein